jgi:hypothetical protein
MDPKKIPNIYLSCENNQVLKIRMSYFDSQNHIVTATYEHRGPISMTPKELKPLHVMTFDKKDLLIPNQSSTSTVTPNKKET